MSLILSFARTTAALLAGAKSVTRREWSDRTYNMWEKRIGQDFCCWSKSPHRNGKLIAVARLVSVTRQPTFRIPDSDWEAEGFAYMELHGINVDKDLSCAELWEQWRHDRELITSVIRFENVRPLEGFTPEMFWPGAGK